MVERRESAGIVSNENYPIPKSSLIETILAIEATKPPEPAVSSSRLFLPLEYELQRLDIVDHATTSVQVVRLDPEFKELEENLATRERLFESPEDDRKKNKEALDVYLQFLATGNNFEARIVVASPPFREYMLNSAKDKPLGPYFQRLLKKIDDANPETILSFAKGGGLAAIQLLDHNDDWLSKRLKDIAKAVESAPPPPDDPEERKVYETIYFGNSEFNAHIVEARGNHTLYADMILDTAFDESHGLWGVFVRENFLMFLAPTHALLSPEKYKPFEEHEWRKSLFDHVDEEQWEGLLQYYLLANSKRYSPLKERIDAEIMNGDTSGLKLLNKFYALTEKNSSKDRSVQSLDEAKTLDYCVEMYATGLIDEDMFLRVGEVWKKIKEAIETLPVEFQRSFNASIDKGFLKYEYLYAYPDEAATLVSAGFVPLLEMVKQLADSPQLSEALVGFGKNTMTSGIVRDIPSVAEYWVKGYLAGKLSPADLNLAEKGILTADTQRLAILEKIDGDGDKVNITKWIFEKICKSHFITEESEKLENLAGIVISLFENGIIPTIEIVGFALEDDRYMEELQNLKRLTAEGGFDISNQIQKDLEFGKYLELRGSPAVSLAMYDDFLLLPFVTINEESEEQNETFDEKVMQEIQVTAIEAARVYWLVKEAADQGNEVMVIGNERYGKLFVIDPIKDELQSLGVKVESMYVNSSNTVDRKIPFSQEQIEYIKQNQPEIFIVDGTRNPGSKDKLRFPNSFGKVANWVTQNLLQYGIEYSHPNLDQQEEIAIGDSNVKLLDSESSGPTVTFVNSTIDTISSSSGLPDTHEPGYFDDYEKFFRSDSKNVFTQRGVATIRQGNDFLKWPSQDRFVSAVQREITTEIQNTLFHPFSDPKTPIN